MNSALKKSFEFPLFLIVVSVMLIGMAEINRSLSHAKPERIAAVTEKKLRYLEEKMSRSLATIATLSSDTAFHDYFIHRGLQNFGFSFFYAENEKITKWSDNETDINCHIADTCQSNSLVHLNNGWYEIFIRKKEGKEVIGLILIRKEYAYENQYLVNGFNPWLGLPATATLLSKHDPESFGVRGADGPVVFDVKFFNASNESIGFGLNSWLYILSFLIFLLAVFLTGKILSAVSSVWTFLLTIALLALRTWMIHLRIPDSLYSTPLFSPQFYASSFYFNSLGDLILNTLIILCVSGIFYSALTNKNTPAKKGNAFSRVISLVFIFLLSLLLNNLISGLIVNSKISFDVGNLFGMNENSLLGFFVIAILLWSYFLVVFGLIKRFFHDAAITVFTGFVAVSLVLSALLFLLLSKLDWSSLLNPAMPTLVIAMLFGIFFGTRKQEEKISLNFLIYITLLFSIYSSLVIWKLNDRKEKENRKLIAQKIETGQDKIGEYLFEDLGKKISKDPIVQKHFRDALNVHEQISKRLLQFYFTGYWSKFNISVYCFDRNNLFFDSLRTPFSLDSLKTKIDFDETARTPPQLYYLNNESGQQQYAAIIPIMEDKTGTPSIGSIAVVLTPKLFQSTQGFPELFVSSKVAFNKELSKYSYARYRNDSLLNQSGSFSYYFSVNAFHPSTDEYSFADVDGYNHLIHRINNSSIIIVSTENESTLILFTLFSYLFSMFSLLVLLFYFLWQIINRQNLYHLTLTRRIQLSVMLLVILSFVLIGSGTVYYITHKYDVNKDESIRSKISSLLAIMEKEFGDETNLNSRVSDENQASLIKLSGTFDADFNLFSLNGRLCYSSQPKIFEQGIISQKMNPEALFELSEKGKTQFVHPESIGKLNYIAAYEPFRNRQGKMIGYLHLPYFEKQNELNKEISSFLSALINIYVLLFALAIIVTLFISSRITIPLLLIQEKLSNIRIGTKNELIEYRRHDEIGELVNEYNRMIEELASSAERLARSERESAWREMAKQVAHEIKNPLTPMKLSVQHLQQAWKEKSPQLNEIFQRISQTLVQQIDTLSNIATEFSNFAQMPQAKKETVDLSQVLVSTIDLFKELPNINLNFSEDEGKKLVFADKDQLNRVFSNLLKNAIQSIPTDKDGNIIVSIRKNEDHFIISVSDNGIGIPAERVERIFTPSFTTKSGGMGLGLSIVKSIVESSDGKIWFETKEESGTTFYISLPEASGHF